MTAPFPPQFFILLGIDVFLGASILVVLFDKDFPVGLPYILDFGALLGFVELLLVPGYLANYPIELQFAYSVAFATLAVLSVVGCSLYLAIRRKILTGGVIAIAGGLPSALALTYFASAWVNDVTVPLPLFPVMPWSVVWGAFIAASAIILLSMGLIVRERRENPGQS